MDVVIGLGVVLLALAALLAPASSRDRVNALELSLTLLSTAPLIACRVAPRATLTTLCAGLVTMALCGFEPAIGGLPPAFATASVAYNGDRRAAVLAGLAFGVAAVFATVLTVGDATELVAPLAVAVALAVMAAGIGDALRTLRARNEELELLRTAEARDAVVRERVRIARDVHDVVGHALAGIALQARAGQRLLGRDPDTVAANLATIDGLASRALAETRASIGSIRDPRQPGELAPMPKLGNLEQLVAGLRQDDLTVDLVLAVDPETVPDALQTAVYRIVQEALSNVVRHAHASTAAVAISEGAGRLDVQVNDDGCGRPCDGSGGHGLRGMRERVALHGGVLRAGPRAGGGWLVRAEIPLSRG